MSTKMCNLCGLLLRVARCCNILLRKYYLPTPFLKICKRFVASPYQPKERKGHICKIFDASPYQPKERKGQYKYRVLGRAFTFVNFHHCL